MIYPKPLKKGDKIAICSPAGKIKPEIVNKAAAVLRGQGYRVEIMPHAFGADGQFSGTADERYADLKAAFADPDVRLIFFLLILCRIFSAAAATAWCISSIASTSCR